MLVHIVPTVPPAVNGLGDYCYKLWEYWPAPKPEWHCLAATVPQGSRQQWPEVGLSSFKSSEQGLLMALDAVNAESVVLHYVGHAYHPKGCPKWLPGALTAWKKRSNGQLTVMFHELYAKGKPWQSSFWLSPISRRIMADLAQLSDQWITNCSAARTKLLAESMAEPAKGAMIPVGANIVPRSNVEVRKIWPLTTGKRLKIVIFGLPNTRLWTLRAHENLLNQLCRFDLVESIMLVGKSQNDARFLKAEQEIVSRIGFPAMWHRRYDLPSEELSAILLDQDLGLVSIWPALLTKSTVYAALCAHGVITIATKPAGGIDIGDTPAFINLDAKPDSCISMLNNENAVNVLKGEIQEAAKTWLNWNCIAKQWADVQNGVGKYGA